MFPMGPAGGSAVGPVAQVDLCGRTSPLAVALDPGGAASGWSPVSPY